MSKHRSGWRACATIVFGLVRVATTLMAAAVIGPAYQAMEKAMFVLTDPGLTALPRK